MKLFSYGLLRISPLSLTQINTIHYSKLKSYFLKYKNISLKESSKNEEFRLIWNEIISIENVNIQILSNKSIFQNGLYFTGKLDEEKIKKRTLVKYLTRVLFKTSPFSSFTILAIVKLGQKLKTNKVQEIMASYHLNGYLAQGIFNLLADYELKNNCLKLSFSINKNILIDSKTGLVKLLRTQFSKEEIVTLKYEKTLKKILSNFGDFNGTINDWSSKLKKMDAELFEGQKSNQAFFNLFKSGIIVHELHNRHDEKNPMKVLLEVLSKKEIKDSQAIAIRVNLNEILAVFDILNNHKLVVNDIKSSITLLKLKIRNLLVLIEDKAKPNHNLRSLLESKNFVYQDCFLEEKFALKNENIENLVKFLDEFLSFIPQNFDTSFLRKLKFVKSTSFSTSNEIPFLTFYEAYQSALFLNEKSKEILNDTIEDTIQHSLAEESNYVKFNKYINNLIENIDYDENKSHVVIRNVKLDINQAINGNESHGMLCMFEFNKKNIPRKLIINAIGDGGGKLFSRFVNLFESELKENIVEFNLTSNYEDLVIEASDNSFFTANIHPNLGFDKINYSGHINNSKILFKDINILFEKEKVNLSWKGRKTSFIDLGFQSLKGRSPIFQFLINISNLANKSYPYILNTLNQKYLKSANQIIERPRISISNKVVLQRKNWEINISHLRFLIGQKINQDEELIFFFLNLFDGEFEFFVRIKLIDLDRNDAFKPQYLNIFSPVLLDLFKNILKKSDGLIYFEEVLPKFKDSLNLDNSKYVSEYYLQWIESKPIL